MKNARRALKSATLVGCLTCLAACSSDDDSESSPGATTSGATTSGATTSGTTTSGATTSGATTSGTTTSGTTTSGATTSGATTSGTTTSGATTSGDLLDATALFRTIDCGSLPTAATAFSTDPASPAAFAEGEIVSGRIDPSSATNTVHYWNIDLPAGFHHVVLDTARVDDLNSNVGLMLIDRDSEGSGRILSGNEIDHRTRLHTFVEIETSRTLRLQLEPRFDAEDYRLGVFPNGADVPSPRFDECPTLTPFGPGDTVATELADSADPETSEAWYVIDELSIGDYLLSSSAQRVDGDSSNIIYDVIAVDQFGQESRMEMINRVNQIARNADASGALNRTESGKVWLRVHNRNDALAVQMTLEDDS